MKRLLFVVEAMGGGVFTYIVDLANELSNNYDVYVAYGIRKQTPQNYKDYFDKKVHLIKVNSFTRSINIKSDLSAFNEIRKIKEIVKPDIIHLHSSKAGVLGRIAFKNFDGPLFYTPHGYSFLMKNIGHIKKFFYYFIEKLCSNIKGITIACSLGEYKVAKKLSSNATYVNNGINVEKLKKLSDIMQPFHSNKLTVVTVGRISLQKNPILFNEIAKMMPNVSFKWIGDGELRDELTASNVSITGWLDRKNVLAHLMSADIFILTSLWEGLPMSLLEAMYLQKICIVSDVVGNNDVICNGENGFICKDRYDFFSTIQEIKSNQIDTKAIKMTALSDVLSVYNTKTMAKGYKKIYENEGN